MINKQVIVHHHPTSLNKRSITVMHHMYTILKYNVLMYRIVLKFGGAKLWQINLHGNFERLNFGETRTM